MFEESVLQPREARVQTTPTEQIARAVAAFARNYVTAHLVADGAEALELIKPSLAPGMTVATGNSLTLRQTGIFAYLTTGKHGATFVNQFEAGLDFAENRRRKKLGLTADVYLSSANALTEDGKICCLDGGGNRVAALLFGPERVFIVAGRNKLVANERAAWRRIQHSVSPQTAVLLGRDLPCAADGKCHDCGSPERFCRYYVTIDGQLARDRDRITVIIIDQDFGL